MALILIRQTIIIIVCGPSSSLPRSAVTTTVYVRNITTTCTVACHFTPTVLMLPLQDSSQVA